MDGDAYTALRLRCDAEQPAWETVAATVHDRLRGALRSAGIDAEVSARAKDAYSLLRKMVFKYQTDDLSKAGDRAGARVVVHLPSQLDEVCGIVESQFDVLDKDNKSTGLKPDEFRYRGIHYDVVVNDPGIAPGDVTGQVRCEIQVRTVAEHAWSVLSHLLLYKSPGEEDIPADIRRRVNRLIAIVELFDMEAIAAHTQITTRPEYATHKLVYDLERTHARTVGDLTESVQRCDLDLTGALLPLYGDDPSPSDTLAEFAAARAPDLRNAIIYNPPVVSPLVRMPEAFIIWERLDYDSVAVAQHWPATGYPLEYLQDLAIAWGTDVPDI